MSAAAAPPSLFTRVSSLLALPLKPEERVLPRVTLSAEAAPDPRPVVSFGGCGLLYPYQLGVVQYLRQEFDCSQVRCAGHSAGFASALSLATGVQPEAHWDVLCDARARWAQRPLGYCLDSEAAWMAPYLRALQAHEAEVVEAAAEGRLCLGHTRLRLRGRAGWRLPLLRVGHCVTSRFSSLTDFVQCVTVSQRIPPFYRAPGWRDGAWGLDGALSSSFTIPPHAAEEKVITVSPANRTATICPAADARFPLRWFVQLPDEQRWELLRRRGFEDAAAARQKLIERGLVPLAGTPRRSRCLEERAGGSPA